MLEPVNYEDYLNTLKQNPYYADRWPYYAEAIKQTMEFKPNTCLELGTWDFPLFKNSIPMNQQSCKMGGVIHDARKTPWPFENKQFDIFMALQVFEHLDGHQSKIFEEVKRVARRAIISLPLEW